MNTNINPKIRHSDLVVQELADEVLIYDLRTDKAFCLNQTAAFVWQHADGETSVEQIAYLLHRKLKTAVDESIVWLALERFGKDDLLENKVAAPLTFAGMNRRDLIKTLGKSAAVALPLVMSLVAPTAASAQSGLRADGQTCTNGAQCSGGGCQNGACCSAAGRVCGICCSTLTCDNTGICRQGRPAG